MVFVKKSRSMCNHCLAVRLQSREEHFRSPLSCSCCSMALWMLFGWEPLKWETDHNRTFFPPVLFLFSFVLLLRLLCQLNPRFLI